MHALHICNYYNWEIIIVYTNFVILVVSIQYFYIQSCSIWDTIHHVSKIKSCQHTKKNAFIILNLIYKTYATCRAFTYVRYLPLPFSLCEKLAQSLPLSRTSCEHAVLQPVPHWWRPINFSWIHSPPESGHWSERGCFNAAQYFELVRLGLKKNLSQPKLSRHSALNALGALSRT